MPQLMSEFDAIVVSLSLTPFLFTTKKKDVNEREVFWMLSAWKSDRISKVL